MFKAVEKRTRHHTMVQKMVAMTQNIVLLPECSGMDSVPISGQLKVLLKKMDKEVKND